MMPPPRDRASQPQRQLFRTARISGRAIITNSVCIVRAQRVFAARMRGMPGGFCAGFFVWVVGWPGIFR